MRRVHSHVLLVLDKDAKKTIDRIFNRASAISLRFGGLHRLFFRGEFNAEKSEWEYTDVKDPTIARSKLLADLALTSRDIKELLAIVDDFREEVKKT